MLGKMLSHENIRHLRIQYILYPSEVTFSTSDLIFRLRISGPKYIVA